MMRIAIVGGGIAGLAAAYELEQQRQRGAPVDWTLFEASHRLGGTIKTTRHVTPEGDFILEGGPDAWVTEKPWARALAEELGLGDQIIPCHEAAKKTYIWSNNELVAMPPRMRMMVPEDLQALANSSLFSAKAQAAYRDEISRAEQLKAASPEEDESIASFVRRHFGDEVLEKVGAPLLSGVFGGDVRTLSVRAVMTSFVQMEAEHGSLIVALRAQRRARGDRPAPPTFTSLQRGMGTLVDALVAALPRTRVKLDTTITSVRPLTTRRWSLDIGESSTDGASQLAVDHLLLATPVDITRALLSAVSPEAGALVPAEASSAVLCSFCWPAPMATHFPVPPGFGFLVPQSHDDDRLGLPSLLAATFTDQKFAHRVPPGGRIVRAFFGGQLASILQGRPDAEIIALAWQELLRILPGLPKPKEDLTVVDRWPRSLPQYAVGHLERLQRLESCVHALGNIDLLGNGYRGVGVPDLIREARRAGCTLAQVAHLREQETIASLQPQHVAVD